MEVEEIFQEHITLDLTDCRYVMEFWKRIKESFAFQEHFGNNWDAFWDMLKWECPACSVTVIGANTLPPDWKALDGETFSEKIQKILQKNKEFLAKYNEEFTYEFIDS